MKSQTRVSHHFQSAIMTLVLFIVCFTNPSSANGQTTSADASAWDALRSGKAVGIMRHALAPGTGDPLEFDVNNCTTQRNLSDSGRKQAKSIGDLLRKNGINAATVLTSQWCRCVETAELLDFGKPEETTFLNSFFRDRSTEPEQTGALAKYIQSSTAKQSGPIVMVTHQVNISALTQQFASSGDMLIVTVENTVEVLAQISTDVD